MKPTKPTKYFEGITKVLEQRGKDYGPADVNLNHTGELWSVFLGAGIKITGEQVAQMMILLKMSRHRHVPIDDNPIDIIGYAYCMDVCRKAAEGAEPVVIATRCPACSHPLCDDANKAWLYCNKCDMLYTIKYLKELADANTKSKD